MNQTQTPLPNNNPRRDSNPTVSRTVSQAVSNSVAPKPTTSSGKKIFFGFLGTLLGLGLLFYGLFLWSLLNGNLSNPLFDTIGLNPADLKNFMKNTTNILFGGMALVFLILFLAKVFQWILTPKEDLRKPRLLKLSAIYFGFLVSIATIWGILFLLISQTSAKNVTSKQSLIQTDPANIQNISAPKLIKFDIGNKLFKQIDAKNVKSITWNLDGDEDFDDASGPTISYKFTKKGTYPVQAKVIYTIQNGTIEKEYIDTKNITISNESVQADLEATPVLGQSPLSVQLSAEKSSDPDGEIVLYEWDLDDDQDFELKGAEKKVINKVFDTIGDHIVRLRVTGRNNDFSVAETKIVVTEPDEKIRAEIVSPDAKFSGVAPFKITLDGSQSFTKNGAIKSYEWQIEGEPKTIKNRKISRTFNVPGQYKVTLTIENSNGEKDQVEQVIHVTENIHLNIKTAPKTSEEGVLTGIAPFEVTFDGSDSQISKAIEWRWDFNNDELIDAYGKKTTHIFRQPGTFLVQFTVIDENNQTFKKTQKVIVNNPPINAKITTNTISGEAPLEIHFDASGSTANNESIINYIWKFPDTDPINSSAQISREFAQPGIYPVELTIITDSGKTAQTKVFISVLTSQIKSIINANLTSGKAPLMVQFDGSDSVGDIVEWKWEFGDKNTSTEINPAHQFTTPGEYQVKLRVKDPKGLINTSYQTISVQ
ncbi:hypothetical protein CSB37_01950 [bacterium DOLZORAL124_38_8]|nr:MAG: hypothetical protein CSB37_01950 [bacterium DOLZORAL124_38_8]